MGKKKSAPVDPRSVPVPAVTHCVFCGKRLSPQTVSENRGACSECSSPVGKMAEIWVNLWLKERYAGTRTTVSDYFESLPTWPAIQNFACAKFSHTTFTTVTWKRLQLWLSAERGIDEGTFLRMLPEAVAQLLGDDDKASAAASALVQPTKVVYISYKCSDGTDAGREREAFVDRLDASLQTAGYDIRRDKRDIGYKDSILKFMDELGDGHCIVVVLSDDYLRSEFCMYELSQIYLNHDFRERICPVLVSDFHGLKRREQDEYVRYWVNERDEAQQDVASIAGGIGQNAYGAGVGRIRDIAHYVADVLSHVFDMKCFNQAQLDADSFQQLKQAIAKRMEETPASTNCST